MIFMILFYTIILIFVNGNGIISTFKKCVYIAYINRKSV